MGLFAWIFGSSSLLDCVQALAEAPHGLSLHPTDLVCPKPLFVVHFLIRIYSYYIGWLCVGINSSIFSYFSIAYISQWYLRTRYPRWFVKYNYVLAAALDGGTQVRIGSLIPALTVLMGSL